MYATTNARSLGVGLLIGMALVVALPQVAAAAEKTRSNGVLARGSGYAAPQGSPAVKRLQRALRAAGHSPGKVDGLYGPRTARAVRRLQAAHGMKADGVAGPRTRLVLARVVSARREPAAAPAPKPRGPGAG